MGSPVGAAGGGHADAVRAGLAQHRLTLLEVMAVLVVTAVLAAVSIRAIATSGPGLAAEAATLRTHLRFVQSLAMAGGTEQSWGLSIAADRTVLFRDGAPAAGIALPGHTGAERLFRGGVTVTAGTGLVAFDAWGSAGNADRVVTLSDGRDTVGVTITAGTGFVP